MSTNETEIKNIPIPMPVKTERLTLRGVLPEHADALFEAKEETHEDLNRWMPWAHERDTLENTRKMMGEAAQKFENREDLMILAFDRNDGHFIGSSGLHRMDWRMRIFEIGYWVRSSETGKGYASEIANALTRYAFGALNASKVTIAHAGGNDASRRVIEKLGFEKEGVFKRDKMLPNGTVFDIHWYARFNNHNLPELKVTW